MYASTIKRELARKYAWRHFLSVKDKIGDWVWATLSVAICIFGATYFAAHWFVFILKHSN